MLICYKYDSDQSAFDPMHEKTFIDDSGRQKIVQRTYASPFSNEIDRLILLKKKINIVPIYFFK